MEGFSDNTVNLRVQVAENFFSSWITIHCSSFYVFLSGAVVAFSILGYGATSLADMFPTSWGNVVVLSSRAEVSKKKNKKWKSWTLQRLKLRPLRCFARSDTINCAVQNLCHKKIWFRAGLRLSQSMQLHFRLSKGYYDCDRLFSSRYRLLSLPGTRRTTQHWQSVGRGVGPVLICQEEKETPHICFIFTFVLTWHVLIIGPARDMWAPRVR
jgi:hypothetical protein